MYFFSEVIKGLWLSKQITCESWKKVKIRGGTFVSVTFVLIKILNHLE